MTLLQFLVTFIIYSIVGWAIDAAYRSLEAGRWKRGGFSKYPFSPVFGFGALLVLGMAPALQPLPLPAQIFIYMLVLGSYELLAGTLVVAVLKKRLWDYSGSYLNIQGHTSPAYAFGWSLLALCLVYFMHPLLLRVMTLADQST